MGREALRVGLYTQRTVRVIRKQRCVCYDVINVAVTELLLFLFSDRFVCTEAGNERSGPGCKDIR